MKNKVLIVFKYPRDHLNIPIVSKFSNFYDTEYVYLSDYKDKNFTQIILNVIVIQPKSISLLDIFYLYIHRD